MGKSFLDFSENFIIGFVDPWKEAASPWFALHVVVKPLTVKMWLQLFKVVLL